MDGDGRSDLLEVETRYFKGPCRLEASGLPLHDDNQPIVTERIYLAKDNEDLLYNEITIIDRALTRPWMVMKKLVRDRNVKWFEDARTENNHHVVIGKERYFINGDGLLMPVKKNQEPLDLRYFKQSQ